jgi:hydroxymethylglutaryl-CoA reductase
VNSLVDTSNLDKFYKKSMEERVQIITEKCNLGSDEVTLLTSIVEPGVMKTLDGMIENAIGVFPIPLGIATNFIINKKERLVTMAIEEPSVIAGASNAARMARPNGGFETSEVPSLMIGQVQLVDLEDSDAAMVAIKEHQEEIMAMANEQDPILIKAGGGARRIDIFRIDTNLGVMLDVQLVIDCLDAMGANVVNTMVEMIAPILETITRGRALLRIISNLAVHRVARARATFDKELLGGSDVVVNIIEAVEFAKNDMYRATTHNKGIMNGVSAVTRATGNDTRAVEAGAHAYASWNHAYQPLTRFDVDDAGNLVGEIELPVAVGIIGGATKTLPVARLCLKIMEIESANDLSQVIAAVGLAQNVAALRALASEGIQQGHMKLHAKNIVRMAGIPEGEMSDRVLQLMIDRGKIRLDVAAAIYRELQDSEAADIFKERNK